VTKADKRQEVTGMRVRNCLIVILLIIFSGCTAPVQLYDGPALPEDEVATLRNQGIMRSVILDGNDPVMAEKLSILPGEHTIKFSYKPDVRLWEYRDDKGYSEEFAVTLEQGHTYAINTRRLYQSSADSVLGTMMESAAAAFKEKRLFFRIVDVETNKQVAGNFEPINSVHFKMEWEKGVTGR